MTEIAAAFFVGLVIGGALVEFSHWTETRYLRACLRTANDRFAEAYREAAELRERETELETVIEAFLIQYGPEGVTEASIAQAKVNREKTS